MVQMNMTEDGEYAKGEDNSREFLEENVANQFVF